MSIEVMKQALEALEANQPVNYCMNNNGEKFPMFKSDPLRQQRNEKAIQSLRQAIEQAEKQEPVAWCVLEPWLSGKFEAQDCFSDVALDANVGWVPLYTAPQPQREWVEVECPLCGEMAVAHTHPVLNKRKWVGLTRDQVEELFWPWSNNTEYKIPLFEFRQVYSIIEAKLKEKNT